ncbi:MAG TPA: M81 family metallopeptidase [Acidimicrobiia bacterium]|nr:M81 family metallopeptidase [Acidimicrobiia bacterium]
MSRIGVVGMWHETNTYSPRVTSRADFESYELLAGGDLLDRHTGAESVIGGFIAGTRHHELVPIFSAGAWPAGPPDEATAMWLLGGLAEELQGVGGLDGVLVNLHGAMVARGHPDFERDTLEVVRSHVGDVPIVCVLDFHGNPSPEFVALVDVVISYDTYPHVDMFQRGREAAEFIDRLLGGERLGTWVGKYPLLVCPLAQATESAPMLDVILEAKALADELSLDRVCVAGGFGYSDVERAGMSVLVTAHVDREEAAHRLIAAVLDKIDSMADAFDVSRPSPSEAVELARAAVERPVVLADVADNIGGGSSGDGTAILSELLEQGVTGALVIIADREMAENAHRAGEGGRVDGMLGGKTDDLHGPPVRVIAEVRGVSDGGYESQGSWGAGLEFSMGPTAWLSVEGNDVIVTSKPTPPFHVEQVTHLGIDPAEASVIVAKGAVAWKAAYGDVARSVIEVDAPGVCPVDVARLPRETVPVGYPR